MGTEAALPSLVRQCQGSILTFVVPAPDGCDLSCPFCYIRQRGENRAEISLSPEDYSRFIREVTERESVAAVAIQGYEPLLDASFDFTQAILAMGRWLGLKTSLISNGTRLEYCVDTLSILRPDRISISLDAADATDHDRLRGKAGAFGATIRGLKSAVAGLHATTEIAVNSVLLPKRRSQLEGVPALLDELGVKLWVVTALQKVGVETIGGPVGGHARILNDLRILQAEAHRYGIEFVADDEFGKLADCLDEEAADALRIRCLSRPEHIYRLLPNGQCSRGSDLLRELPYDAPRWKPGKIHAGDFVRSLREKEVAFA